jgi:sigma-B regulation protein RsbU (phosphoserine phosphatase)
VVPAEVFSPSRLAQVLRTGLLDTGPEEAFDRFARLASMTIPGTTAFVTLVDEERSFWKACVAVGGPQPEARQNAVEESFCQYVIARDDRLVVSDARHDPVARHNPSVELMGVMAWAGYPVRAPDGEVLGTFCVVDTKPRPWSDSELILLETLSHAVEGEIALRLEVRRVEELSAVLQESLLPATLPTIPGLEVGARYRPAGRGVEVLGDFYDAFRIPQGWAIVIGDVCGKGAEAARTTALSRSTLRALGHEGQDGVEVLRGLDEVLADWNAGAWKPVSAAYCSVALAPGEVTASITLAGHPPPVVRGTDGRVEPLGRLGTALGCRLPACHRTVTRVLRLGDALVLYTDGVTEARDADSQDLFGEERLRRLLADLPSDATAQEIADAVVLSVARFSRGPLADDCAVLVLRNPSAEP